MTDTDRDAFVRRLVSVGRGAVDEVEETCETQEEYEAAVHVWDAVFDVILDELVG